MKIIWEKRHARHLRAWNYNIILYLIKLYKICNISGSFAENFFYSYQDLIIWHLLWAFCYVKFANFNYFKFVVCVNVNMIMYSIMLVLNLLCSIITLKFFSFHKVLRMINSDNFTQNNSFDFLVNSPRFKLTFLNLTRLFQYTSLKLT